MLAVYSNSDLSSGIVQIPAWLRIFLGTWVSTPQSHYHPWLFGILRQRQGMIKNREAIYP